MSSGQELYAQRDGLHQTLERSLGLLGKNGRENAQAEHDYRVAMAKKYLILKDAGYPATLIRDLVRGDEEIAKLAFERDVAEVNYKAGLESINVRKLELKSIEAQIERENRG